MRLSRRRRAKGQSVLQRRWGVKDYTGGDEEAKRRRERRDEAKITTRNYDREREFKGSSEDKSELSSEEGKLSNTKTSSPYITSLPRNGNT